MTAVLDDCAVDFAFASNLSGHLVSGAFSLTADSLRRKLPQDRTLTIVQPNDRYAHREYFKPIGKRMLDRARLRR